MIIKIFKKDSPERVSNGHYKINIEGTYIDFMSIWTFKSKNGLPKNNRGQNDIDSKEMNEKYGEYPYRCLTEKVEPIEVFLHPVEQMEVFYKID